APFRREIRRTSDRGQFTPAEIVCLSLACCFVATVAGCRLPMAALKLRDDVVDRQLAQREQEQQMVDEVGGFGRHPALVLRDRGERELDAFLADLLRDLQRPLRGEPGRVAAGRRGRDALLDGLLQRAQERESAHCSPPVAGRTAMPASARYAFSSAML